MLQKKENAKFTPLRCKLGVQKFTIVYSSLELAMQDKVFNTPIINTKRYRPPLQTDFIPRPQPLEQLEGWQQKPHTLVSAPTSLNSEPA